MIPTCHLPDAREIGYLTPSRALGLSSCLLRMAYGSDSATGAQGPSTQAARLGTAVHEVLQAAGEGKLGSTGDTEWEDAFTSAWATAIADQADAASRSPVESRWGPPERWRYFGMRKVEAKRLARQISAEVSGPGGQPQIAEHSARAFGGKLAGRADVVLRGPKHEIRDYKTGAVTDPDSDDLKAEYRTQMLLYAVIEHDETGEWPTTATIISLRGARVEIPIEPSEAMACAENALEALAKYNAAVKAGAALTRLASPAPGNCRFCPYAARCPAFWETAEPAWEEAGIRAVAGRVLSVENAQKGHVALELAVEAGSKPAGSTWVHAIDPSVFPVVAEVSPETFIAATSLLASGPSLRPSERTRLVAAPTGDAT